MPIVVVINLKKLFVNVPGNNIEFSWHECQHEDINTLTDIIPMGNWKPLYTKKKL